MKIGDFKDSSATVKSCTLLKKRSGITSVLCYIIFNHFLINKIGVRQFLSKIFLYL